MNTNTNRDYTSIVINDEETPADVYLDDPMPSLPVSTAHESLIRQLLKMGFTLRAAMICVQITSSNSEDSSLEKIFEFFTTNENGFYNHPFISEGKKESCAICFGIESKHSYSTDVHHYERFRGTLS